MRPFRLAHLLQTLELHVAHPQIGIFAKRAACHQQLVAGLGPGFHVDAFVQANQFHRNLVATNLILVITGRLGLEIERGQQQRLIGIDGLLFRIELFITETQIVFPSVFVGNAHRRQHAFRIDGPDVVAILNKNGLVILQPATRAVWQRKGGGVVQFIMHRARQ